jgi:hypothetical protein
VFERLVELPQAYAGYDGDGGNQNPHVYGNQFRPDLHATVSFSMKWLYVTGLVWISQFRFSFRRIPPQL